MDAINDFFTAFTGQQDRVSVGCSLAMPVIVDVAAIVIELSVTKLTIRVGNLHAERSVSGDVQVKAFPAKI